MIPGRFAIVAARFNDEVVGRLLKSCLRTLKAAGVGPSRVAVLRVPGSFDIPWAAQEAARSRRYDAVICLGVIMKGQTSHDRHIAAATIPHLQSIALETRVPVVLGIITPATMAQALARTRGGLDRGREAAEAALELAALRRKGLPR